MSWFYPSNFHTTGARFLPFPEARRYARNLGLEGTAQWKIWAKTQDRPKNIPSNPYSVYENRGWDGWGDWLGTGRRRIYTRRSGELLSFEEAREWVHQNVDCSSEPEWYAWAKTPQRPSFIPGDPRSFYPEFQGITDWCGYQKRRRQPSDYLPFEEAREFVRAQGLQSTKEWEAWMSSASAGPAFIPIRPDTVYNEQFVDWYDWLGLLKYAPFEEAREWVRQANITSLGFEGHLSQQWHTWAHSNARPPFIPITPREVYKGSFVSIADWLGVKQGRRRGPYLPFEEAREYVRQLGLLSRADWDNWIASGDRLDIPSKPWREYKDKGWISPTDWFEYPATEQSLVPLPMRRAIKRRMREKHPTIASMLSYAQAKKLIQSVAAQENWESFTDVHEWLRREDRPEYFPRNPQVFYEDWWKGWIDFVGFELAPVSQTGGPGFVGAPPWQILPEYWDEDLYY